MTFVKPENIITWKNYSGFTREKLAAQTRNIKHYGFLHDLTFLTAEVEPHFH